jgi:hypothetical protein
MGLKVEGADWGVAAAGGLCVKEADEEAGTFLGCSCIDVEAWAWVAVVLEG